eukprot:14453331-Heterocapsa_arctica.AAC.1
MAVLMRRTNDADKRMGSLLSRTWWYGSSSAVNSAVDRPIAMEAARDIMDERITTSPAWGNMPRVLTDGAGNSRLKTCAETTAKLIEG